MFTFNNTGPLFTFKFNPSWRDVPVDSPLIGLGDDSDMESHKGTALNSKGYRADRYNPISELVANTDDRQ